MINDPNTVPIPAPKEEKTHIKTPIKNSIHKLYIRFALGSFVSYQPPKFIQISLKTFNTHFSIT